RSASGATPGSTARSTALAARRPVRRPRTGRCKCCRSSASGAARGNPAGSTGQSAPRRAPGHRQDRRRLAGRGPRGKELSGNNLKVSGIINLPCLGSLSGGKLLCPEQYIEGFASVPVRIVENRPRVPLLNSIEPSIGWSHPLTKKATLVRCLLGKPIWSRSHRTPSSDYRHEPEHDSPWSCRPETTP